MRVMQINSVPYGSTCRVMLGICRAARLQAIHCDTASGYSTHPAKDLPGEHYCIGGPAGKALHMTLARLTGLNGCFSLLATLRLIGQIRRERVDLLHFHNLHGWYVHLPLLMRYVKRRRLPVVWTLHDCWAFTGQCAHYTAVGCQRWKSGCGRCMQKQVYPQSAIDLSRRMYRAKQRWFASLPDAVLVTPSQWLARQVSQSFLSGLPVRVIPNGIDCDAFQPTPGGLAAGDRHVVLGVANGWTRQKGLDTMIELAGRLGCSYQLVLVGTDSRTDLQLPSGILSIHRTSDAVELARLYTAAEVFVNPTREDTFPTVNLEALACGTPVITFDAGGSAECIDETCGLAVAPGDVNALENAIRRVCTEKPFSAQSCIRRARQFDQKTAYAAYLALYRQKAGEKP